MTTRTWREWSCTVRVVVGQDESVPEATLDDAVTTVGELMAGVDRAVSRFREDSELEAVNDAAPRLVPVGALTMTLVDVALEAAERTDGAVDPTVGGHVLAWGYDADIAAVRGAGALRHVGPIDEPGADWRRVVVDHRLRRIGVARGLRLDLGATAKAWTADEAARRIAARHGLPTLVEIGGDVAVAGRAVAPWRVRVAETAEGPGEVIGLTYGGLATSSTVARRWRTDAGEAHHIVDPSTGAPADGDIRTATVWAPSCVLANTFSTASLIWGDSSAARLEPAGLAARLVDQGGDVHRLGPWPVGERVA